MKIYRNTPCSCGSGKKYKRCCGAGTQLGDELSQDSWAEQLTQAINSSQATSLDELNAIIQHMNTKHNARPINEFLGLSPSQMSEMLYQPLESPGLVTFNDTWFPEKSSAIDLFNALATSIGTDGAKATSKGNLPIQLCRDILANTPEDLLMRPPRIRTEVEFDELNTIRLVSEMAGLIQKHKGYFRLTEAGQALTAPEHRARLFRVLFNVYVSSFNWGYRDGYPDIEIIQTGWLFSLYCLSSLGLAWRPSRFYAEKFLEAFPQALEETSNNKFFSAEDKFYHCYISRTLSRFAHFWGLVDMRMLATPDQFTFEYEVQAPQLTNWIQFHA